MLDTKKIKQLREGLGLKQPQAADKAKMTIQQWNNIERGNVGQKRGISLTTLKKVAKALGVEAKDLLK